MIWPISPLRSQAQTMVRDPTNSIPKPQPSNTNTNPILSQPDASHEEERVLASCRRGNSNCHRLIPSPFLLPSLGGFRAHQLCVLVSSKAQANTLSPFTSPSSPPLPRREEDRGTKWRRVDAREPFDLLLLLPSPPTNQEGWRRSPPSS